MHAAERRKQIVERLKNAKGPMSASALASELSVSRQIIVGDVALLRAAEMNIAATPRGYVLQTQTEEGKRFVIACRHQDDQIRDELYAVVDNGGEIVDVIVEHPLYGQISGKLCITSRYEADLFVDKLKQNAANPLCKLTGGIHLHTLKCENRESYERIVAKLREMGILFDEE